MSGDLVLPGTGEVISSDDPAAVARGLDTIAELSRALASAKRVLVELLVAEAQRQGTKTLHLEGATVTLSGGTRLRWDLAKLRELEAAGLPAERLNAFLRPKVTYAPDGNVARQLRGSNPEYARIIDEARIDEPAPWSARVERRAAGPEQVHRLASGPEQEDEPPQDRVHVEQPVGSTPREEEAEWTDAS